MNKLWARLVRFGFRLLYHELAWTYDTVSSIVSFGQWRAWVGTSIEVVDAQPGMRVLELAHGTGNLQLDLCDRGMLSVGVDISPQMGRLALRKLTRAGCSTRLVRASALALPFAPGIFDAIVCTFPTPFIFQAEALSEASRVLKSDGRLVIVVNAVLTGSDAATTAVEWLYRVTGQRGDGTGFDLRAVFSRAGFAARIEERRQPRSIVTLIVAEKC